MLQARAQGFLGLSQAGMHATDLFHSACKAVKRARQRFCREETGLLADLLRNGQEAGEFASSYDPDRAAHVLIQALASFSPPFIFELSEEELSEKLVMLHQLLLNGLLSRQG